MPDKVISLHEYLDWGPIDCPAEDRVAWIEGHSPSDVGWDWLVQSIERFRSEAAAVEQPLIWIAPRSANELCGLFWYLDQIRPENTEMVIVDFPVSGGWREEPPLSLGELSTERMAEILDRVPTQWEPQGFPPDRWSMLVREGALLRVVRDGKLQSAPANFFDELILRRSPREWTKWSRIVGDTMGDAWDLGHHPDDSLLKWRLQQLVNEGRLEMDGDLSSHDIRKAARLRRTA